MKIPIDSKILSISHNDLDGVGCQILLGAIYKNITYMNLSYLDIDKRLLNLDETKYDFIFVTDISPNVVEVMDRFDNLILIDHHQTAEHNPKKNRFVKTTHSATYLTHHFLTRKYGDSIMSKYTKFVTLVNDYDMWELNYKGSKPLNDLYRKYNANKFRERFKSGILKLSKSEIDYIKRVKSNFNKIYNEIEIYDFESINACYFLSDTLVNEIAHKLLHTDGYDCVFFNTMKSYKLSVRSKLEDFNFGVYLKDKGVGGGHKQAAGIDVGTEEELNTMLNNIEEWLYQDIPSIRK